MIVRLGHYYHFLSKACETNAAMLANELMGWQTKFAKHIEKTGKYTHIFKYVSSDKCVFIESCVMNGTVVKVLNNEDIG